MKKLIALILVFVLAFSICACSSDSKKDADKDDKTVESVDVQTILSDLDNQAKADKHIGKSTTLFGRVEEISSESCKLYHSLALDEEQTPLSFESYIKMPTDQLEKLNTDDYVAITAIIEKTQKDEENGNFYYTFKDGKLDDIAKFDKFVSDTYSSLDAYKIISTDSLYNFAENYAEFRNEALRYNEEDITDFITGTWYYQYATGSSYPNHITCECTYTSSDLTFEYLSYSGDVSESTRDWSYNNGILDSFFGEEYVYKISDNVIWYGNEILSKKA